MKRRQQKKATQQENKTSEKKTEYFSKNTSTTATNSYRETTLSTADAVTIVTFTSSKKVLSMHLFPDEQEHQQILTQWYYLFPTLTTEVCRVENGRYYMIHYYMILYSSMPDLFADLLEDIYCNWQQNKITSKSESREAELPNKELLDIFNLTSLLNADMKILAKTLLKVLTLVVVK